LALTSPTSGGHSVGTVPSRTQAGIFLPARKSDKLIAVCGIIFYKTWDPVRLTIQQVSMALRFTLLFVCVLDFSSFRTNFGYMNPDYGLIRMFEVLL
jgi:hypothetical protein